jgi:hypothetical protein
MPESRKKIGIIGGGKVGLKMFNLFYKSDLTDVLYVVDINPQAPARIAAKEAGVKSLGSIKEVESIQVDFIVEVTGAEQVIEQLHQIQADHTQVITHDMAYVIMQVIDENSQQAKQEVFADVRQIQEKMRGNLENVEELVHHIESVTSEMRILALNARIEAARAGDQGKGFAVVSEQMARAVDDVLSIAVQINGVNNNISATANEIQGAINRLN